MNGRYEVIRYPLYYVVIDHRKDREIVFESKDRLRAHRKAGRLNKASDRTLSGDATGEVA